MINHQPHLKSTDSLPHLNDISFRMLEILYQSPSIHLDNRKILGQVSMKISDGHINACIYELKEAGLIDSCLVNHKAGHYLTQPGEKAFLAAFESKEMALQKKKIDFLTAERVYTTYRTARFIAWAGFLLALLLAALKIAEMLQIWPDKK